MRSLPTLLLALATSWTASGQTYTISTLAGGGPPVNIPGPSASLDGPQFLAVDIHGNVFFVDRNAVLRLDAVTGILSLVAGNGAAGFSGDNGPATGAQLNGPRGVALDSAGNVYVADNHRIRKIANGVITTVAGGGASLGDNGPATSALLVNPAGICVDSAGNLYIADSDDQRVRKVANGVITTVAGNGTSGFSGENGVPTNAQLNVPTSVALDSSGNLYIADSGNHRIRRVANGVIGTIAGNGTSGCSGDNGAAVNAQLFNPSGVAVDPAGSVFIADTNNQRIRELTLGVITTLAGDGMQNVSGDGADASMAELSYPFGIALAAGNLYVSDSDELTTSFNCIREINAGIISTVAGGGTSIGDNGPAVDAQLSGPAGVTQDSAGNLYIADFGNNVIRRISNGIITTVAGSGTQGYSGDAGPAINAELFNPSGVALDPAGNLYISDYGNNVIRKVTNGVITTVAGNGTQSYTGDRGPATAAGLDGPAGLSLDSSGNLYFADSFNHSIRKVANGVITTVAGNGTIGFAGDNGLAINAQLDLPTGVAADSAGSLYIADSQNDRIRKVANGVISTVAGNGTTGFGGDLGPATAAELNNPAAVAVDPGGNLYIADSFNKRIRKVAGGVITTLAGGGASLGDKGPGTSAQLNNPEDIVVNSAGILYIADSDDNRIRVLTPNASSCTYSVAPTSLQAPASGGNLTVAIQTGTSCSWAVTGLPNSITTTATSGTGPATITLVVAANTNSPLSATISVAGTPVTIAQPVSGCTYAIDPGGQAVPASGGTGLLVNVTTTAGCAWSATSTATWIHIVAGTASGTGNGTVSYQADTNSGPPQSGIITIAGLSFTVEESAASITGLTGAGSMAQLASAGSWTTTITLVNTGSAAELARLNFFDNNGRPAALRWTFPQVPNLAGPIVGASFDRILYPGAELVLQTTGPDSQPTTVGWVQLQSNGSIGGYAIFSYANGATVQDAVAPLETRNASAYILSFDNTNGNAAGVALANLTSQSVTVTATVRDDTGAVILSVPIALLASGHTSFTLTDRFGSSVSQKRGTLVFSTPSAGQISVLGIRGNSTGAFSDIPALTQ
jgi:sugar lactone lactonase YvrE